MKLKCRPGAAVEDEAYNNSTAKTLEEAKQQGSNNNNSTAKTLEEAKQQGSDNNNGTTTSLECKSRSKYGDVNVGPITGIELKPVGIIPTEESSGFQDLDGFWSALSQQDNTAAGTTDIELAHDEPDDATEPTTEDIDQHKNDTATLERTHQMLVCRICGGTLCQ